MLILSIKAKGEEQKAGSNERSRCGETDIYMHRLFEKDFDRPQYKIMVGKMEKGDLLYILSIDRLGRSYEEIQRQWRILAKEISIDILCDRHAVAGYAERERPDGNIYCRPCVAQAQLSEEFSKIVRNWERKRISIDETLERCGVSESTFYRKVRE